MPYYLPYLLRQVKADVRKFLLRIGGYIAGGSMTLPY